MRVLLELGTFPAPDAAALYAGVRAIDWTQHLDLRHTLAVSATVKDNPALAHTGFAALKVKDAVVDALRDKLGARPDVHATDPDVPIVLHLEGRAASLYLDLTGEPLHRRGYRAAMTDAPLKESLAAAVLAIGGADPAAPFVDPMAGGGTLAIEQALRARDRAPAPILAADADPQAIAAARKNAQQAGVAADITFTVADVSRAQPPSATGTLCTNPPYGERLGHAPGDDLAATYQALVDTLRRFDRWRQVILTGNPLWSRTYLRRPEITHRLWNGPLEARLLVYQPRGGSRAE
jgi:23S rRNA G2445 N2-methylase RlmL